MTSKLEVVEELESGVPSENQRLTPSHWQLSHMPRSGFETMQWLEIACSQWHGLGPDGHQRTKPILPNVINHDQTGFLAGRFIGESTRLTYDTIHQWEVEN